jgi:hypothetical protein
MTMKNPNQVVDQIYGSGYFTNHGPLAKELEESLQDYFQVGNAVVVGNESLALIIALAGMDLGGRVGVSAHCPEFVVNAVAWAALESVITHVESAPDDLVAVLICAGPVGVTDLALLHHARSRRTKIVVYQHGHFGRKLEDGPVVTVTTVGTTAGVPTSHCAVILTDDGSLAEKYRNIRSSYGARKIVEVRATANGRVSDFQAGMALMFLQNVRNRKG